MASRSRDEEHEESPLAAVLDTIALIVGYVDAVYFGFAALLIPAVAFSLSDDESVGSSAAWIAVGHGLVAVLLVASIAGQVPSSPIGRLCLYCLLIVAYVVGLGYVLG